MLGLAAVRQAAGLRQLMALGLSADLLALRPELLPPEVDLACSARRGRGFAVGSAGACSQPLQVASSSKQAADLSRDDSESPDHGRGLMLNSPRTC